MCTLPDHLVVQVIINLKFNKDLLSIVKKTDIIVYQLEEITMQNLVDWVEATYLADRLDKGLLTPEAVSQRLHKSLKRGDKECYLTLKVAQALVQFKKKVEV